MPPKIKITKSDIVDTAVNIIRRNGEAALNARNIAASLGCSTQPVFSNFSTMEEVKAAVIAAADKLYQSYQCKEMGSGDFPPYKASGIAYIRFAREEKELFKLLFMRDRTGEKISNNSEEIDSLIHMIKRNTGLSKEEAYLFHLEMWMYVHGIATMIATAYLEWDWNMISRMLTDAYQGMLKRYTYKED